MLKSFIKKIVDKIKTYDKNVDNYRKIAKIESLPSIAYLNWGVYLAIMGKNDEAFQKMSVSTVVILRTRRKITRKNPSESCKTKNVPTGAFFLANFGFLRYNQSILWKRECTG